MRVDRCIRPTSWTDPSAPEIHVGDLCAHRRHERLHVGETRREKHSQYKSQGKELSRRRRKRHA